MPLEGVQAEPLVVGKLDLRQTVFAGPPKVGELQRRCGGAAWGWHPCRQHWRLAKISGRCSCADASGVSGSGVRPRVQDSCESVKRSVHRRSSTFKSAGSIRFHAGPRSALESKAKRLPRMRESLWRTKCPVRTRSCTATGRSHGPRL